MKIKDLHYEMNDIITVLASITSKEGILEFLMDVMTEKEMLELARRLEVAKLLEQEVSYSLIERKTKMSSATIAKVSKALNSNNLGYKNALNILSGK